MAGNLGRLNPQYYQSSGESTPQAELPEQFVSNAPATSPLSSHLTVGYMDSWDIRRVPVVSRVERTVGMRTTYSRTTHRMPIRRQGADGQPTPWNSSAQPLLKGPIASTHNNDALFQAGYPGFNLGISFKVPTLNTTNGGSGMISPTPSLMQNPGILSPATLRRATRANRGT
jgi:hypothetical protein